MATRDLSKFGVRLVPATKKHTQQLARVGSKRDRDMIKSIGGWTDPDRYARANLNRSSEAWAIYHHDFFVGVVGVICFQKNALRDGYQHPWYVLAEHVDDELLEAGREFVDGLRDRYPLLIAMVRASDTQAQIGLTALGFSLMAPAKFGKSPDLWCKAVLDTRRVELADAC